MSKDPIQEIGGLRPSRGELDPQQARPARSASPTHTPSFKELLADSLREVQRLENEADSAIKKLVAGEIKDVTEVMVAVEKADLAFQTMMAVRNRLVAAYEEVMRMQV